MKKAMHPALVLIPLFLAPLTVFAGDSATYNLMAPIGNTLTGSVDLSTYLQGAVKVIIGLAGVLAVLMLVICGIKTMGNPSVAAKSEAKECIANAIFGLLLALGAWMLLNTINPQILSGDLSMGNVAPPVSAPAGAPQTLPPGIYQASPGTSCQPVAGKMAQVMPPSYCPNLPEGNVCCRYVDTITVGSGTPNPILTYLPPDDGTDVPPPPDTPPTPTPVGFSDTNFTVIEGAGSIMLSVSRTSSQGSGTVDYATFSLSATPGVDYTDKFGTLSFPEGVSVRTISVPVVNNPPIENTERFRVTLSNPTGVITLGGTTESTIAIEDDDAAPSVDIQAPTVTITSPLPNRTVTESPVDVTFTASDTSNIAGTAIIRRLEYEYAPPSGVRSTMVICDGNCTTPTVTMTVSVPVDANAAGIHGIHIRACDSRQCSSREVTFRVEASCISDSYVTCKTLPTGESSTWSPYFCSNTYGGTGISASVLGPAPTFTTEQAAQPCFYAVQRDASGNVAICTDIDYDGDGNPDSYSCPYGTWTTVRFTTDTNGNGFADEYEFLPDVAYALDANNDGLMDGTNYPAAKNAIDGNDDGIADGYEYPVNRYLPVMQSCPQTAAAAHKVHAYAFKLTSDNNSIRYVAVSGGAQNEYPAPVGQYGSCSGNPYCEYIGSDESGYHWRCPYVPTNVLVSVSARAGDLTSSPSTTYNTESRVRGYCGNTNGNPPGTAETLLKISTSAGAGICTVELDRTYYVNVTTVPFIITALPTWYWGNIEYVWDNMYDKYSLFWDFLP